MAAVAIVMQAVTELHLAAAEEEEHLVSELVLVLSWLGAVEEAAVVLELLEPETL